MAKPRNYAAEYAARKAKALAAGYTSPRARYTAQRKAKGLPGRNTDYALEAERRRIRRESVGVDTDAEYRAYRRAEQGGELALKKWTLSYFGISANRFEQIRRENKKYRDWMQANGSATASAANTYDSARDIEVHNWSPMRVGYIIAFHGAVVNPATNWESLPDNKGKRARPGGGIKKMNKEQFYYLVFYTNLMSVDYFEARYGHQVVLDAYKSNGKVKP
jgi:hypothetical protein